MSLLHSKLWPTKPEVLHLYQNLQVIKRNKNLGEDNKQQFMELDSCTLSKDVFNTKVSHSDLILLK